MAVQVQPGGVGPIPSLSYRCVIQILLRYNLKLHIILLSLHARYPLGVSTLGSNIRKPNLPFGPFRMSP